jgi:hypothetical protein
MADENEQKAIESDFIQSWDWMEQFFVDFSLEEGWDWITSIQGLIAELRSREYDRKFRAGQSLYVFVLSRSRKHGMRLEQPALRFELKREGGMKVQYWEYPDTRTEFEVASVEITPEIEALLARLLAQPID